MKSIRSRLLAFSIVATLVPSLGLGVLSFWRHQALVGDNVGIELRTRANYARSELALWLREQSDAVRALAGANPLLDALTPDGERRDTAARRSAALYLQSVRERLTNLHSLTLYDAAGRPLSSSLDALPARALSAPPARRLPGDAWVPEAGSTTADATTIVVPVLSSSDAPLGYLAADVSLAALAARLRHAASPAAGETILLAADGRPLLATAGAASPPAAIAPRAIARLREHPGEPVDYVGHRGEAVIGTLASPGPWPFDLVTERTRTDVLRAWRDLLQLYALLVLVLTLVVGLAAWRIGRSIVLPLERLVDAADRIGAGDLALHLETRDRAEIGRLTRVFDGMVVRLRESRAQADAANAALQRQNRQLEALSVTDALTGLSNRKRLDDVLAEQFALFRRSGRPATVVMIDIDHFKRLNDTHGHLAGDRVLVHVADVLRRSVRAVDHVARYGGEEFAAVLVDASARGALDTAERIRASIEASTATFEGTPLRVTVSVGVSRSRDTDTSPQQAVARADAALYAAKHAGRNRVVDAVHETAGRHV